jgi:pyruvate kinase
MLDAVEARAGVFSNVHPDRRESARNLICYLTLRRHDVRGLQPGLASLGVSSLGRIESRVLATIDAVLRQLDDDARPHPLSQSSRDDFDLGEHILSWQTEQLLGAAPAGRHVRIMVTMPAEAADDYAIVHDLVREGMNCMRINCAHGSSADWLRMIQHLRRAESVLNTRCKLLMDLSGAKLRTGPVAPGPAVLKVRPVRDVFGRVTAPARIWLTTRTAEGYMPSPAAAALPITDTWLAQLAAGTQIKFLDARDAHRRMTVAAVESAGAWAELSQTAYFVPGTVLRIVDGDAIEPAEPSTLVGDLPPVAGEIRLAEGDTLVVTRGLRPGRPALRDSDGHVLTPATIGCSQPQVFDDVRVGEAIWFDDGRFGGTIDRVSGDSLMVRLTHAPPDGGRLGGDKGINLPDSTLHVPALTEKDLLDLAFVVQHADIVGLSFANSAEDVDALLRHIAQRGPQRPALMLKIETRRGFERLPEMLLAAMKTPCFGVMIARGDLAVECGFERLAEVQEELLWICEAAHVPAVWATQVLEGLAKYGTPSRAEITDAAMGHRAECVMLNKGPHIVTAVRALDDILRRMDAHQSKKRAMLRELHLAHML